MSGKFPNGFKDLDVWQRSKELSVQIYYAFSEVKDYSLKDQIQRASVSIMNNIAEGFDRYNDKEMNYFLRIAKGSLGEVESMIDLSLDLGMIDSIQYQNLSQMVKEVRALIISYINSIFQKYNKNAVKEK